MKKNDSLNSKDEGHKSPSMEVIPRAKRRRFSASYKLRILEAADSCETREDVGALLRREGLYSSHLTQWRHQRSKGTRLGATQAGKELTAKDEEIQRLKKELSQSNRELKNPKNIIEIQKKSQCFFPKAARTRTPS